MILINKNTGMKLKLLYADPINKTCEVKILDFGIESFRNYKVGHVVTMINKFDNNWIFIDEDQMTKNEQIENINSEIKDLKNRLEIAENKLKNIKPDIKFIPGKMYKMNGEYLVCLNDYGNGEYSFISDIRRFVVCCEKDFTDKEIEVFDSKGYNEMGKIITKFFNDDLSKLECL